MRRMESVKPHSEHLHRRHLIEIGKTYTHVSPYTFNYHWRVDENHTSTNERMFSEREALEAAERFIDTTYGQTYGTY